jgi:hypothetical protein
VGCLCMRTCQIDQISTDCCSLGGHVGGLFMPSFPSKSGKAPSVTCKGQSGRRSLLRALRGRLHSSSLEASLRPRSAAVLLRVLFNGYLVQTLHYTRCSSVSLMMGIVAPYIYLCVLHTR